jgi:hypothetical protein
VVDAVQTGQVVWRTEAYAPGYLADHWRDGGHVMDLREGTLISELRDGRCFGMTPGTSYQVSDFGDAAHRSRTDTNAH